MPRAQPAAEAPKIDRAALIVVVHDITLDCGNALPVRMDTWNVLREQGVDPMRLARSGQNEQMELEPLQKIARAVVRRAAKLAGVLQQGIPDSAIDEALDMKQVTTIAMATMNMEGVGAPLDRPTSTESSALPNGGSGAHTISNASPSAS